MLPALLLALACTVGASPSSYVDYSGVKMPQYSGAEYEMGRDSQSHQSEDYQGHSPDVPASLDYKYEEETNSKTEVPIKDVDESDQWRKSGRKPKESIRTTGSDSHLRNKYDGADDEIPKVRTSRRYHRTRLKNEIDAENEKPTRRHKKYSRERKDIVSDMHRKDYFNIDKDYNADDKNKELDVDVKLMKETTTKRPKRRRPRDRQFKRQQSDVFEEYAEEVEAERQREQDKLRKGTGEIHHSDDDSMLRRGQLPDRRNMPGGLAPERTAPRILSPDRTPGDRNMPERIVPDRIIPERLMPERIMPDLGLEKDALDRDALDRDVLDRDAIDREILDRDPSEQEPGLDSERLHPDRPPHDRLGLDRLGLDRLGLDRLGPDRNRDAVEHRVPARIGPERNGPDHSTPDHLRYRPIPDAEDEPRDNAPKESHPKPKPKTYDEYDDYYDMKRVNNIKNKLPTLQHRSTVSTTTTEAFTNLLDMLTNRRMMTESIPVWTWPSRRTTKRTTRRTTRKTPKKTRRRPNTPGKPTTRPPRTTAHNVTTTSTASTSPRIISSFNNTRELSLAEKSRLSILKKAQRKEGLAIRTTKKPPVLLQVTSQMPTVVMVEPPSSTLAWMRARDIVEDSPARIEMVKRLMRHKLVAESKSIHDLTDNWDDMVCDYIDTSLLDNAGGPPPAFHFSMFFLQFCVFVLNT